MEFGMKRVLASVQAAATLNKLYDGSPVSLTAISKESKLSTSYLEQIFKKLRTGNLVISQRGPRGGYSPRGDDITVTEVITAVSKLPAHKTFEPILRALDDVRVSHAAGRLASPIKHKTRARRVKYPVSRPKLSGIEF
ncbi:Rrf2 family transcriptional regulator [Klebsiella variicola]|uniref:Rrf2 family transcriptional regulator n=2 Tax=Klebsiella variicola TaxID=244366 RepID=UPI002B0577A6|nr:Rrf2 family transcriptional regulator [Klebsiella variicola]